MSFSKLSLNEQVRLVNKALESEVYPMLERDGGGLEILDIQGNKVHIQYYGACGHCPIGEAVTLPFIEQTLQAEVDPRIKVILEKPELP
ncbi:MAG: NifU family protein [Candidatus Peregrinibacteria bacterium]